MSSDTRCQLVNQIHLDTWRVCAPPSFILATCVALFPPYVPEHRFEDLAGRFERPDPRNRWDAPLFTVVPGKQGSVLCLQGMHTFTSQSDWKMTLAKGGCQQVGVLGIPYVRSCVKPL